MKVEAIVRINGDVAHFDVSPLARGVYFANLVRFEGRPEQTPPEEIILVRGLHNWRGSCDRAELVYELGEVIDDVVQSAPIFRHANSPERRHDKRGTPEQ
jgi:hypothetical protein